MRKTARKIVPVYDRYSPKLHLPDICVSVCVRYKYVRDETSENADATHQPA